MNDVEEIVMELGDKIISAGLDVDYGIVFQVHDKISLKEITQLRVALDKDGRSYRIGKGNEIVHEKIAKIE